MNDTETRLRDYLHAKADTVPDSANGPGLELDSTGTSTRRRWVPMAVAAAGIAAVLTLAVPYLHGLAKHDDQPSVAGLPAQGPVSTGAPLIPYTTLVQNNPDNPLDTWWALLHDGGKTVKNPGLKGNVVARTEGGWLVTSGYPDPDKAQVAVLSPTGKVRPIGPLGGDAPRVSPDGTQIAVALSKYGRTDNRVVVVDIRTGKEVASLTVKIPNLELIGWNKDGIWMSEHSPNPVAVKLWKPGSTDVRTVGTFSAYTLDVTRSNNIVTRITYKGNQACVTAATLGAKGLEAKREYCFKATVAAPYVTVSPDGATMTISTGVAVDIATGKVTKLRLPATAKWFENGIFEDPANLIVVDESGPAQKLFRCAVATGECKQVATAKPDETIRQVQP
ncbi:hypothetical protein ACQPYH_13480 [Kribbella sp. CA-245084]|uniref:hypothetical protein n=1 Tax=Kribbella sp. CA-245084 TaxID=3239940 RepID=UPI003D8B747E